VTLIFDYIEMHNQFQETANHGLRGDMNWR
jgi:hypothetical protein